MGTYVVISGMQGGYMPSNISEPMEYDEAIEYAHDEAEQWVENSWQYEENERYTVSDCDLEFYSIDYPNNPHKLGYYIEIAPYED